MRRRIVQRFRRGRIVQRLMWRFIQWFRGWWRRIIHWWRRII